MEKAYSVSCYHQHDFSTGCHSVSQIIGKQASDQDQTNIPDLFWLSWRTFEPNKGGHNAFQQIFSSFGRKNSRRKERTSTLIESTRILNHWSKYCQYSVDSRHWSLSRHHCHRCYHLSLDITKMSKFAFGMWSEGVGSTHRKLFVVTVSP